ncbi:porin [Noviherbaspirillum aerium]|uniref:porin n=1 Tax=Noviherbaspirillum aerium TaxID=2588497 RepID=UPI00124C40AF|nr:porin [Noviherbaspirillum aerium]
MKHTIFAAAVLIASGIAQAQSNVTIYGILDTTIRYTTNENAAGRNKWQLGDGVLTGSRIGFRGTESLGGGLNAIFNLESGILPDTGALGAGGNLFGRNSTVGLSGDFGTITFGRQFTTGHDMIGSLHSMAVPNLNMPGFQAQYTTTRFDNSIKYRGTFGAFEVGANYAFGEVAGDSSNSAKGAVSLAYKAGGLRIGGTYQRRNDVTSYFGTTVPLSDSDFMAAGATYETGPAKLYFMQLQHKLDGANRRNDGTHLGIRYAIAPAVTLIGSFDYDKLETAGPSGKRTTTTVMALYDLSKRTQLYAEVDHTKLKDAWRTLGSTAGFNTPFFGTDSRTGVSLGIRHYF